MEIEHQHPDDPGSNKQPRDEHAAGDEQDSKNARHDGVPGEPAKDDDDDDNGEDVVEEAAEDTVIY